MAELRSRSQRIKSRIALQCLIAFLLLFSVSGFSQSYFSPCPPKIDTVFDRGIYKSYFSYQLQQPLYVSYVLSKGGGGCSRSKFRFKNDTGVEMADTEYSGSGYDRGHLANAEDFAYDCVKDELTFRYYNCLPQTPNMNRGAWKSWETKIRQESQSDSLLVICGGMWRENRAVNSMIIPTECWKIVYSLKTQKVLHVLIFTNLVQGSSCTVTDITTLEKFLGCQVPLKF